MTAPAGERFAVSLGVGYAPTKSIAQTVGRQESSMPQIQGRIGHEDSMPAYGQDNSLTNKQGHMSYTYLTGNFVKSMALM